MCVKKEGQRQFFLYCLLPALLWMGFIFYMSGQVAEISGGMSLEASRISGKLMVRHFSELPVAKQLAYMQNIEVFVRKTAHGVEYVVLGVLLLRVWDRVTSHLKRTWIVGGYGSCVLYAISDEFHQQFVPGRKCELRDVLIDSAGAACGCLVYLLVRRIRRRETSGKTIPTGK